MLNSSPRSTLTICLCAIVVLLNSLQGTGGQAIASPILSFDFVSVVDPPGLGEIDEEIGNVSLSSFEALGPVVNDLENGTGPVGNTPFLVGNVTVTGVYSLGGPPNVGNFSGERSSLTDNGGGVGAWSYMGVDPNDSRFNYSQFNFSPLPGQTVTAAGVGFIGRNNRVADGTLYGIVTFADTTTLMASIDTDSTGDGLPNGKDVFVGFQDTGGHGGITRLELRYEQTAQGGHYFTGWDSLGVVTAGVPFVPEPSSFALCGIAGITAVGFGIWRRWAR